MDFLQKEQAKKIWKVNSTLAGSPVMTAGNSGHRLKMLAFRLETE